MIEDESSAATVTGLSVPQKASLCLGSDYWHTAGLGACRGSAMASAAATVPQPAA